MRKVLNLSARQNPTTRAEGEREAIKMLNGLSLNPDHPTIKLLTFIFMIVISFVAVTGSISTVIGYSFTELASMRTYRLAIVAIIGIVTIIWVQKKPSWNTIKAILKTCAIVMLLYIFLDAISPGITVRQVASANGHSEYSRYSRGVYPLGVNVGEMTEWILPQGNSYNIDSKDYNFSFITPDAQEIPGSEKSRWPRNRPFKIYAKTDQRGAVLVVN